MYNFKKRGQIKKDKLITIGSMEWFRRAAKFLKHFERVPGSEVEENLWKKKES